MNLACQRLLNIVKLRQISIFQLTKIGSLINSWNRCDRDASIPVWNLASPTTECATLPNWQTYLGAPHLSPTQERNKAVSNSMYPYHAPSSKLEDNRRVSRLVTAAIWTGIIPTLLVSLLGLTVNGIRLGEALSQGGFSAAQAFVANERSLGHLLAVCIVCALQMIGGFRQNRFCAALAMAAIWAFT
ncbi:MAG: hypothetical protein JO002_11795, partial [Burkholderiaceae bacterium]|nr:hypothetical protein [Burkholderiaceae bacterium]